MHKTLEEQNRGEKLKSGKLGEMRYELKTARCCIIKNILVVLQPENERTSERNLIVGRSGVMREERLFRT